LKNDRNNIRKAIETQPSYEDVKSRVQSNNNSKKQSENKKSIDEKLLREAFAYADHLRVSIA